MEISKKHFNHLMRQAAEACMRDEVDAFLAEDISDVKISARVDANVYRAIYSSKPSHITIRNYLLKIAVVILVICTVGFVFCMCHPAIRSLFFNVVRSFYEDHIGIAYTVSQEDTPATLEEFFTPDIPNTWKKQVISENESLMWYTLLGASGEKINFRQCPVQENNEVGIDNHPIQTEDFYLNGSTPATLYTYPDGTQILLWLDRYAFTMVAENTPRETLLALAASVSPQ